ncbi:helix-turn-helix domain-containing protein [Mycolicibacterium sp.]|uniref:helix-turn-helix domain-containing protein n=1 Tax=Mycolicibacterium sp. TaxID=2320850 RepID=UPI003D1210C1
MATPPNRQLGQLIDDYKRTHSATDSGLAQRIGITRQSLMQWRTGEFAALPKAANLRALATEIGRPYRQVLGAALLDSGYLTPADDQTARPYDEVLHDAIAVLTEARRLTNQPMRHTSSGHWEPDPYPRSALPIDWAEFVTLALAGAAANAGGIETILAGRPGSWEAERIRQTLQSTVFDEQDLMRHRTDPITVDLWVEAVLALTGDTTEDDQGAELALRDQQNAIPLPHDIPPGPFKPDDPRIAEIDWLSVGDDGNLVVAPWLDWPVTINQDKLAVYEELVDEARNSRPDTPGEIAYERAFDEIEAVSTALDSQRKADYAAYAQRLTTAIETKLRELNPTVPVSVTVTTAPEGATSEEYDAHRPSDYPEDLIEGAVLTAIMDTPTPSDAAPGAPLDRLENGE